VLPLRDAAGALCSLQFIKSDGSKRYLCGGQVSGCYFAIGKPGDVILVGEGFATCVSAYVATGYPVAVAFDGGNLRSVAEALRSKLPNARIVILADDDHLTVGNPGISMAREAAAAAGGAIAVPEFGLDRPEAAKDFNDMMQIAGAAAVKAAIEKGAAEGEPRLEIADARPPEFSDESLALRFSVKHVEHACYVALWGQWLLWDGGPKWKRDDTLKVFTFARAICRVASAEITEPKAAKLAASVASAKTVAAVVTLARVDRRHAMTADQWDPDQWLFTSRDDAKWQRLS
jgi:hypothetical protein